MIRIEDGRVRIVGQRTKLVVDFAQRSAELRFAKLLMSKDVQMCGVRTHINGTKDLGGNRTATTSELGRAVSDAPISERLFRPGTQTGIAAALQSSHSRTFGPLVSDPHPQIEWDLSK